MVDCNGDAQSSAEAEPALPDADEVNLSRAFYDSYRSYHELLKSASEPPSAAALEELTGRLKVIALRVVQLHLFSQNEELDDISTADLKFLLVPFLIAEATAATQDMAQRHQALRQSLVCWRAFAGDCQRLKVAHLDDVNVFEGERDTHDPAERRDQKIARYRRVKDLDAKVAYLFSKKRECTGDEFFWGAGGAFDEDMERELILSLIAKAAAETVDNIASAEQELPLLEMMLNRKGEPPAQRETPDIASKPYIMRIRDKGELMKLYRDMVFQCPFAQPTVTLAEFAEMEMQKMREREGEQRRLAEQAQAEEDDRWFNGDRYGTREIEEDEQKTYKDRGWDNWKDEHPYGSGNKMANLG